ncbi:MAG TPA: peptidoglycan-binding protein [Streptosporangiaceae bacterium]|nr:peptidoglycan-binding protein [Streptosporangiaceae bacterium]
MIREARKSLGLGEPNHIQKWYAERHGSAYGGNFPWCDAAVSYWARRSNSDAVLPAGDRAYTVSHAQDFQRIDRWKSGTTANIKQFARPGDIVFFDWKGTNNIGAIDHVGVIEKVLSDGRVQTIEGNTGNACKRRVRAANVIAGFGRPAYKKSGTGTAGPRPWPGRHLKLTSPFMHGGDVEWVQERLNAKGASPKLTTDGEFGPKTKREVVDYQRSHKLEADGIVGPKTWSSLAR